MTNEEIDGYKLCLPSNLCTWIMIKEEEEQNFYVNSLSETQMKIEDMLFLVLCFRPYFFLFIVL
ncbi:unnamed protein product [Larinioides sclopetarius]|uniref:Uncharacterized protein n=1 Tax=Larinioides sclopetarius TaxID=280406 RepID=A0AAV1Z8U6_9ARAC